MRFRGRVVVALALAVGSLLPVAPADAAAPFGRSRHRLDVGGVARSYLLDRPTSTRASAARGRGAPLLVVLHGRGSTGARAQAGAGWSGAAKRGRFVAVFPDGLGRSWNAGGCCSVAQAEGVDDVAFIRALVADVRRTVSIDGRRIYVTGFSNGAMMAYRLLCETGLFAAGAAVSGTLDTSCVGARRASVLHIHGTADPVVPFAGGRGLSVAQTTATWRAINGCRAPQATPSTRARIRDSTCVRGRHVVSVAIVGGGHSWPGGRLAPGTVDATAMVWPFLRVQRR